MQIITGSAGIAQADPDSYATPRVVAAHLRTTEAELAQIAVPTVPILRERDILTPETADTPAKLVYLAVQLMYISPDPQTQHGTWPCSWRATVL